MKKTDKIPLCPGCKKHCPAHAPCCKYGRKYFETHPVHQKKAYKWDAYTQSGGLIWRFFLLSKNMKKGLKKGAIKENQLLSTLSIEEKEQFDKILQTLEQKMKSFSIGRFNEKGDGYTQSER